MIGFAMLTPVVLIDPGVILNALHGQVLTYSSRPGQTGGNSFGYWLSYLWMPALGPAFAVAAVAGMVAAAVRRERACRFLRYDRLAKYHPFHPCKYRLEPHSVVPGPGHPHRRRARHLRRKAEWLKISRPLSAVAVFVIGATSALAADVDNDLTLMRPDPRTVRPHFCGSGIRRHKLMVPFARTTRPGLRLRIAAVQVIIPDSQTSICSGTATRRSTSSLRYGYTLVRLRRSGSRGSSSIAT